MFSSFVPACMGQGGTVQVRGSGLQYKPNIRFGDSLCQCECECWCPFASRSLSLMVLPGVLYLRISPTKKDAGCSLCLKLLLESTLFAVFPEHKGIGGRSLSVNLSIFSCLFVPFVGGAPYAMAHDHVTCATNEWVKELTKKRRTIPLWMLSVVANIMKPDTDLEAREHLLGDALQWSVDHESCVRIYGRLMMELRREPPRKDKACMLVGLRKARQLKTSANIYRTKSPPPTLEVGGG